MLKLFTVFLKIGCIFFGGGFVLIPVLHKELVLNLHWLSEREFIDGTAISQLTPGPIAVLATFAGYRIEGIIGALIGTFALFLPATLLMLILSRSYEKFRNLSSVQKILGVLSPVIVGLLIAAALHIGQAAIASWQGTIIFVIALIALIRFKISPAFLIIGSAFLGFLFHF